MGLSASQARFLQLTGRKSNTEYQAQQISFQRLQVANKLSDASNEYQDKMSNRKIMYSYNDGTGAKKVDLTYQNYKNFVNQQSGSTGNSQEKYYLVTQTGKIVVASEEEKSQMINNDLDADGNPKFDASNFIIVEDLDNVDMFQNSIKDGVYYFSKWEQQKDNSWGLSAPQSWETMGSGAMIEELDTNDDAKAEADFQKTQTKLQKLDKQLELRLDQLETEREAIQTEIESVSKVIDDNVESTFKVFS